MPMPKLIPPTPKEKKRRARAAEGRLSSRLVRERWPIPADKRKEVAERVAELAVDECQAISLRAAQTLVLMEGQNQQDQSERSKNERLDSGKLTDRVGVDPVIIRRPV